MKSVAVYGGIGSGKSVVCKILAAMGYQVYDCDSRAKKIMDESILIKERIKDEIDAASIMEDGAIDRARLASVVFGDEDKLKRLNGIVHAFVRQDIAEWMKAQEGSDKPVFIETAILYESGLDKMVDEAWEVVSPMPLRIERICARNSVDECTAIKRIEAQNFSPEAEHPYRHQILNDEGHSLLLQIHELLG